MVKNRRHKGVDHRITVLLILGIIISVFIIIVSNRMESQDVRSRAEEGPGFCEDKCIGQDRCGNGPPGDPAYNHPCCEELRKTGDPFACGYPERLYCLPEQCAAIPEGVPRQRCGGSRQSWCNMCIENNCPGYVSQPTALPPTQSPQPTTPPQPTDTPIPLEPSPTEMPIPTVPPGIYSSPTPQSSLPTQPIFYPTSVPTNPPPQITETVENPPTPIPTPFISKVTKQVSDFIQQTKETIIKFFNTILP